MPHKLTVRTNGQTLTVNASVSHWTSEALALAASGTNDVESSTTTTITSDYDLWFANTATTATITVKQLDGTTLLAQTFQVGPGYGPRVVTPVADLFQIARDATRAQLLAVAPSGALAETYSRVGNTPSSQALLSTGRLGMNAIILDAGITVRSATFVSGTTALSGGTNQWFALYDRNLALLGQTADDTNTAWGADSAKTLTFATPITTTYSGLYYLAINVTASTVPTLFGINASTVTNAFSPMIGATSTTSLTGTAPDPAGALSVNSRVAYAYVS